MHMSPRLWTRGPLIALVPPEGYDDVPEKPHRGSKPAAASEEQ